MPGFEKALEEEIAVLEADVAANPDPRILKLEHLRSLRPLYRGVAVPDERREHAFAQVDAAGQAVANALTGVSLFLPSRGTKGVRRKVDPNRVRVIEAARDIVALYFGPVKTAEVYDHMSPEIQALIGGENPQGNLSAMMHHSPLFQSHGRAGWSLALTGDADGRDPDLNREDQLTAF